MIGSALQVSRTEALQARGFRSLVKHMRISVRNQPPQSTWMEPSGEIGIGVGKGLHHIIRAYLDLLDWLSVIERDFDRGVRFLDGLEIGRLVEPTAGAVRFPFVLDESFTGHEPQHGPDDSATDRVSRFTRFRVAFLVLRPESVDHKSVFAAG